MAALQKIRSKGPLLVAVIGLALFAFIAEEAMRSFQSATNESRQQVGEVYGNTISVQEFQKQVDEYLEVIKFTSGNSTFSDEQYAQIRDQIWDMYVNNRIIEHEAEKLGLTVSDAEVQDIILTGSSPLLSQTPFRNEQTGRFDANILKEFLASYESMKMNSAQMPYEYMEYYNNMYNYWMFIEKSLRNETLLQKYQTLLGQAMLSNKVLAEANFNARTEETDVVLAALPYSSVNDNDITVTDADIKAKYNELKSQFEQPVETRNIKFISVQVTASAADKALIDQEIAATAADLAGDGDIAKIVRESGSVINYSKLPISKNAMPSDIASAVDSMKVGDIKAPFYTAGDNSMNVIKLIAKTTAPDSVEVRTIQVAGADMEVAKKTADSIMTALKAGAPFDTIAKKYNQDGSKNWIASAHYEGAILDEDNMKYISTVTTTPVNGIKNIEMTQGYLIAQVTDRRNMIEKYDVAIVKRPIEFSRDTYAKAYNDFSHFVASNPTQAEMEANALTAGYNLQIRNNVFSSDHTIGGVSDTRDALRWVYDEETKAGDVSPLYECGENDHLLVVILTDINEAGYRKMENVKEYLTMEVKKDKKAALLMEKMANVKTWEDAVKVENVATDTIKHITFSSPAYIMVTGSSEPMVSAVASNTEVGTFAGPFKGNSAVYCVQPIKKDKKAGTFNAETEGAQVETANMRAISRFMNELGEKAEVEDNRYLFF